MEYNINEKLWDGYIGKMGGWIMIPSDDGLDKADQAEKQARLGRVADTMWYTFNCHNFGEVFRGCYYEELRNPA